MFCLNYENSRDLWILLKIFHVQLYVQRVTLHLEYRGRISGDGRTGLYHRFYYDSASEKTESLFMTQMQPGHARDVVPCLDEMRFKVTTSQLAQKKVETKIVLFLL